MKSMNDENNGGSISNWLGFMKMVPNQDLSHENHSEIPGNCLNHPTFSQLNTSSCYGVGGNFHSPFSVMETLSTSHSQGMVESSSPKLEDFLKSAVYNQQPFGHQQYYSNCNGLNNSHQISGSLLCHEDEIIPRFKTWFDLEQQINNGNTAQAQSLSLTMCSSPTSQSSCVSASSAHFTTAHCLSAMEITNNKKRGSEKISQSGVVNRKSIDTFGQRTSQYRGVTRHRWTGRYEAHLWDNSCKREGQARKGRQVYLGGYDVEEKAARAYDLAALKYWGPSTHINYPVENYHQQLEEMENMSRLEYVAHLRRKSSGFSRGASIYRGVTRHHQHGRWQARIGRVAGNKDLYLGTFSTQEDAAEAYDIAAIKFRGVNAITNFEVSRYHVEKIVASNTLPTGETARRNKARPQPVQENSTGINYQNPSFLNPNLQLVDKNDTSLILAKPNTVSASSNGNAWIPTVQLRPVPLTMAHLPVFTSSNDGSMLILHGVKN